jgi:hypothetical protein
MTFWQISPQSSRLILVPYLNWDKLRARKTIFSGVSFLLLVLGLYFDAMEYFYLSIFLGGPFLFVLLISNRTRSDLLVIFSLAAFVSAWLAPLGFFWERDK